MACQVELANLHGFLLGTLVTDPINVTLAAPSGSLRLSGGVTSKLARGSPRRFCVCIAIVLIRKTGCPSSSNP